MQRRLGWPYKKEFQCHRCGNCCRGDGYVELTESDVARAAYCLGMTCEEFLREFCESSPDGGVVHLKDQEDELQSCVFLFEDDEGRAGCRIHQAKPAQCQGFPFTWRPRDAVKFCDGLRALEGLPPIGRRTMSEKGG